MASRVPAAAALDARDRRPVGGPRRRSRCPPSGDTVVVLHQRRRRCCMAPAGSDIAKIGDLDGKRVGDPLRREPGDDRLLDAGARLSTTSDPASGDHARAASRRRRLQRARSRPSPSMPCSSWGSVSDGDLLPATVKAVAKAGGHGPPVFLPVARGRLPSRERSAGVMSRSRSFERRLRRNAAASSGRVSIRLSVTYPSCREFADRRPERHLAP